MKTGDRVRVTNMARGTYGESGIIISTYGPPDNRWCTVDLDSRGDGTYEFSVRDLEVLQ